MPNTPNTTNIHEFSIAQSKALAGFAAGLTISEIAHLAEVSRQTVCSWRQDPDFDHAARACTTEYIETFRDQMLTLSRKALTRIEAILDDPTAPHGVALKAALAVLNRPQFPEPGWNLPVKIHTPQQTQMEQNQLAIEIEKKTVEIDLLRQKAAAAPQPPPPTGQNLTPSQPVQSQPQPEPKQQPEPQSQPFTPLDDLDRLFLRTLAATRAKYFAGKNTSEKEPQG